MLFNSQTFLLLFLPVALAAWYLLAKRRAARTWVLIAASFVFYGYWEDANYWDPLHFNDDVAQWLERTLAAAARGEPLDPAFVVALTGS